MKKILLSMMAATMIFATSCENELELGAAGEESVVSFTIATPDMGSRAYSDGTTATVLQYAVYNAAGEELTDLTVTDGEIHGSTTVKLQLTTGNTYSVIFWAAAPNAPYSVDFENKTMTVDYSTGKKASNAENRDAFYKYHTFTVTGAQTEAIELKRPFAQLNIGTSDYVDSEKAGYVPTQSAVTVKNVYSTLNLANGKVAGEREVTFDYANIPVADDGVFPVTGYGYLAMNYVLVPADQELTEVTFSYKDANNNEKTRTVGSVPVQRNYRTNIYGQLLTSEVDINVTIDPEYNEPANNVETIVYNANELQAALEAAGEGTTTIRLATDVEGEVTLAQKPNTEVVFDGGGNTFSGVLTIDGKSATITTAGFTVKNLKFTALASRAAASSDACIRLGDGNNATRYTCNVTVENCIFDAPGLVGVKSYTGGDKNLTITNCTATENAHSLVQAKGIDGVVVKNCEVKSKNGMNFNNSDNVTVEDCTVDVRGYAVRFGESSGGTGAKETYLIKNCSLKSENEDGDAVIILRGTADYSTLTIEDTTIKGDPKITNTATDAKVITIAHVSTADELVAALKANEVVYLLNDITIAATKGGYNKAGILQNKAQTIDGGGHTLTVTGAGATWDCAIYTNGGIIRNLTVAGAFRGIFTAGQSSDLYIENVEFKNVIYTFNSDGDMPVNPFGVYVSESIVNGWTSHSDMHTEVVYTNCSFGEGSGYAFCRPYGKTVFDNCTFSAGYSIDESKTTDITFTNCTWEE